MSSGRGAGPGRVSAPMSVVIGIASTTPMPAAIVATISPAICSVVSSERKVRS